MPFPAPVHEFPTKNVSGGLKFWIRDCLGARITTYDTDVRQRHRAHTLSHRRTAHCEYSDGPQSARWKRNPISSRTNKCHTGVEYYEGSTTLCQITGGKSRLADSYGPCGSYAAHPCKAQGHGSRGSPARSPHCWRVRWSADSGG